jgi:hydroxymethylpyrimidine/phosphomethylpyrimidine kinase
MKSALTIAASDPSGGAGIQADLRSFSYMGVHGCSVITCVTAQNTQKLYQINAVPKMAIEGQLDALLEDIKISACKTGMLYSPGIVELVAEKLEAFDFPLIVDPVMKATVGGKAAYQWL